MHASAQHTYLHCSCCNCREPSYQAENHAAYADSDSDTGWSDVELDDVAAIKFRAVTPPWQRVPDRARMSLALQQRTAAAAAAALGEPVETAAGADWGGGLAGMGSCWGDDGDDTTAKLQQVCKQAGCSIACMHGAKC